MNPIVMTYARYLALKAVKQRFWDQGIKLRTIERRDLVQAANEFIADHPALLIEAAEKVQAIPRLRKIAEQEERRRARHAKLSSDAQRERS